MINRLAIPSSGTVLVDGTDVSEQPPSELRRRIGYVIQHIGLLPHLTVGENVALPLKLQGAGREYRRERAHAVLELTGLEPGDFADRFPGELSGGQQQRVGFARALAAEPKLMLLDEPFGALDPITRTSIQRDFTRIRAELELTGVMVTHDIMEALLLADRIAVMKDGRLVQSGTPREMFTNPRGDYIRELMAMPHEQSERLEQLEEERDA
jgi:osmoprotectant transport system ATP-binding protein